MRLEIGQTVFWVDPDKGTCSSYGRIENCTAEIITLRQRSGGYVDALVGELIEVWHDSEGIWGERQSVLYGPYRTETEAESAFLGLNS